MAKTDVLVKFAGEIATHRCYFDIRPGFIKYYEALYTDDVESIIWKESEFAEDLYLYDPIMQQASSYILREGVFYKIPLQILGNQKFIKQVFLMNVVNDEIKPQLVKTRAAEFNVDINLYPNILITKVSNNSAIESSSYINMEKAYDLLKISKCTKVSSATETPAILADGEMFVWKDGVDWYFSVGFLGQTNNGKFNQVLDQKVIYTLDSSNSQELNFARLESLRAELTRPYLILSYEQQRKVVNNLSIQWLVSDDFLPNENILMCLSAVTGVKISEIDVPNIEQNMILNNEVYAFRSLLFPSTINEYFKKGFYISPLESETTIADVIVFIKYLLIATAKKLGYQQELSFTPPPASSRVKCGQLPQQNTSTTLIHQGLSERDFQFIGMIMNYQDGVLDLDLEGLIEFKQVLDGLIDLPNNPDLQDLAYDLAAIYSAQSGLTNAQATDALCELHVKIRLDVIKKIDEMLITCSIEKLMLLKQHLPDNLRNLIDVVDDPQSRSLLANRDITKHSLKIISSLKTSGLIENPAVIRNLDLILKHKFNPLNSRDEFENSKNPTQALQLLEKAEFLTDYSITTVYSCTYLYYATYILIFIHENEELKEHAIIQRNLHAILDGQLPSYPMIEILLSIIKSFELTDELYAYVFQMRNEDINNCYNIFVNPKIKLLDSLTVELIELFSKIPFIEHSRLIKVMEKLQEFGLPRNFANLNCLIDTDYHGCLSSNENNLISILNMQDIEKLLTGAEAQHNYEHLCRAKFRKSIVKAMLLLKHKDLLTADIVRRMCDNISYNFSENILEGIIYLQNNNLLIPDYIAIVCSNNSPSLIARDIVMWHNKKLLSDDLTRLILETTTSLGKVQALVDSIVFIKSHPILEQNQAIKDNLFRIASHYIDVGEVFLIISNYVPITNDIVDKVLSFEGDYSSHLQDRLDRFIKFLSFNKVMAAELIDILIVKTSIIPSRKVLRALKQLSICDLLLLDNWNIVKNNSRLMSCLANNFSSMKFPLTQKNYITLANSTCLVTKIIDELNVLFDAGLLSEENDQKYRDILMCDDPSGKANVIIELVKLNLFNNDIAEELRLTNQPLKVLEKATIQKEVEENEYICMGFSM